MSATDTRSTELDLSHASPAVRPAVVLQSIRIVRMPGVPRGQGFAIERLAPGVTVVHGPNGIGKSTVARAIELLLWPQASIPAPGPGRPSSAREAGTSGLGPQLAATWLVDGDVWSVELDGRHVEWRRQGRPIPAPDCGPAELRHRYRLDLVDLLQTTDEDDRLAATVQRLLTGGFDLDAIRRERGAGRRPDGRQRAERAMRDARSALRQAQQRAEALEIAQARRLPELERALELARHRATMAESVNQALRRLEAETARAQARATLRELPVEHLRHCRADDEATLDELRRRLEHATTALRRAEETLAREAQRLGGRAVGPEQTDEAAVLERHADEFDQLLAAHRQQQRALDGHREARHQALRLLAPRGQQPSAPEAVAEALAGLREDLDASHLASEDHRLRARREALEAQRRLLQPRQESQRLSESAERLRSATRDLADWLATGPQTGKDRLPWSLVAVAALAAVLAFALMVFHALWWVLALLAAGAIVAIASRIHRDAGESERQAMQERLERSGVRLPPSWTVDAVAAHLRSLEQEAAEAALAERSLTAHVALDEATRTLSEQEARHRLSMRALEERFGATLPTDAGWLPVLARALADWQSAQRKVAQTRGELETLDRQAQQVVQRALARISPLGLGDLPMLRDGLSDPEAGEIGSRLRGIARRLRELIASAVRADEARRDIHGHLQPDAELARATLDRFYRDRGVAPDDLGGLRQRLAELPRFLDADAALARTQGALDQAPPPDPSLPSTREELLALRAEAARADDEREALVEEMGRIRSELDRAAQGSDVTDALSAVDAARRELELVREAERHAAALDEVLRLLEGRGGQRGQPEVLVEARALLARCTHGRFELRLHARTGPEHRTAFAVHDASSSMEKPLAALSAGERVQLLCSVRLAFLEHEERRALPLVVDEALGTSDDRRSAALMEVLIEVARRGRQVLCFTAQLDEVERWKAALEHAGDVPFSIIDLGEIRRAEASRAVPLPSRPPPRAVPPPDDLGHDDYGRLLEVPGLDPLIQAPDQVHLWHAVDDPHILHRLLQEGFTSIGQVLRYRAATGHPPPGCDEATCLRIAVAERGLHRFFERWRIGRCRALDFGDLTATGAVSDTFAPRLRDLLVEVRGDPTRLLEKLDSGAVPRWQRAKTEELRNSLAAAGLLATGAPAGPDELEHDLRIHLHEALREGVLDEAWVRRVVRSVE